MCEYAGLPGLPFFSSSDVSAAGVISCQRVEAPPEGIEYRSWSTLWHLYRLIESWPW